LFTAILFILVKISKVQAQELSPAVFGIVNNGTEGGVLPDELPMTLNVYTDEILTGSYDTTVDNAG